MPITSHTERIQQRKEILEQALPEITRRFIYGCENGEGKSIGQTVDSITEKIALKRFDFNPRIVLSDAIDKVLPRSNHELYDENHLDIVEGGRFIIILPNEYGVDPDTQRHTILDKEQDVLCLQLKVWNYDEAGMKVPEATGTDSEYISVPFTEEQKEQIRAAAEKHLQDEPTYGLSWNGFTMILGPQDYKIEGGMIVLSNPNLVNDFAALTDWELPKQEAVTLKNSLHTIFFPSDAGTKGSPALTKFLNAFLNRPDKELQQQQINAVEELLYRHIDRLDYNADQANDFGDKTTAQIYIKRAKNLSEILANIENHKYQNAKEIAKDIHAFSDKELDKIAYVFERDAVGEHAKDGSER